jgi:hypothetical protein
MIAMLLWTPFGGRPNAEWLGLLLAPAHRRAHH